MSTWKINCSILFCRRVTLLSFVREELWHTLSKMELRILKLFLFYLNISWSSTMAGTTLLWTGIMITLRVPFLTESTTGLPSWVEFKHLSRGWFQSKNWWLCLEFTILERQCRIIQDLQDLGERFPTETGWQTECMSLSWVSTREETFSWFKQDQLLMIMEQKLNPTMNPLLPETTNLSGLVLVRLLREGSCWTLILPYTIALLLMKTETWQENSATSGKMLLSMTVAKLTLPICLFLQMHSFLGTTQTIRLCFTGTWSTHLLTWQAFHRKMTQGVTPQLLQAGSVFPLKIRSQELPAIIWSVKVIYFFKNVLDIQSQFVPPHDFNNMIPFSFWRN